TPPDTSVTRSIACARPAGVPRSASISAFLRSMPMTRSPAAVSRSLSAAPMPEPDPVMAMVLMGSGTPVDLLRQRTGPDLVGEAVREGHDDIEGGVEEHLGVVAVGRRRSRRPRHRDRVALEQVEVEVERRVVDRAVPEHYVHALDLDGTRCDVGAGRVVTTA